MRASGTSGVRYKPVARRKAAPYGNRIVGTGSVAADQLLANPANWRGHPQPQQDVLDGILNAVGFVQHVVVNRRSSKAWGRERGVETLIDGHLRVHLALARGEDTELPVTYVDLEPDEEKAILVSFDPVGVMAFADQEKLDALVADLPDDLRELTAVLRQDGKASKRLVAFETRDRFRVVVDCESVAQQQELLERLQREGLTCRTE